jgi:superfamily II DNA/RNA helicase
LFGRYFSLDIAASTQALVFSATLPPLITRETVIIDTPATRATSDMVGSLALLSTPKAEPDIMIATPGRFN